MPYKHYSSSLMFVPLVGHLFTCDHESTKRYAYYNKLEKNRRIKIYKQLIKNKNEKIIKLINQRLYVDDEEDDDDDDDDDDDEDEDEFEDEDTGEGRREEREKKCLTSKSEQDLRVKKSVTFLAHANTIKPPSSSISPSSTITTDTASTPTFLNDPDKTSPFYDHAYDANKRQQQQEPPPTTISNAPLLQYNALIAMLKSNASAKAQKDHIFNIKEASKSNRQSQGASSPQIVGKSSHKKSVGQKSSSKKEESSNNSRHKDLNYFKKYQVIDTDSISLASLSESPPSEFKFSDEEENTEEDESVRIIRNNSLLLNKQQQEKISNATSLKQEQAPKTIEQQQEREISPTAANVSENIGSNVRAGNQINEINKHLELQRIKQNQMNQIKAAKKNFHAVLLKDVKCKFFMSLFQF